MPEPSFPNRTLALATTLGLFLLAGGCSPPGSPSDKDGWHGYYYDDVLGNAPARMHGPYGDAPQCIAAMHALLRQAPATASFTCGRGCELSDDGSTSNCKEVAR